MKRKILLCLLPALLALGGCGGGETSGSYEGTSITIGGPSYVFIGRTITLSVYGDDNQGVSGASWSSSNEAVATVSEAGVVTGIAEGSVTITATYGDLKAEFAVLVRANQASSSDINLFIETDDDDVYLLDGVYYVPMGVEFTANYSLPDSSYRRFDGVTYAFDSEGSVVADVEYNADGSASITTTALFESMILSFSGSYSSGTAGAIVTSIYVTSYDANAGERTRLDAILSSIEEAEAGLLSASLESGDTSYDLYMYDGCSYAYITAGNDVSYMYSGIYEETSSRYFFSYDEEKNIDEVYEAVAYASSGAAEAKATASLAPFRISGLSYFGFSSLFNEIVDGTSYRGHGAIGAMSAAAYAEYTFSDGSVAITSTYEDYDGSYEKIDFTLSYDSSYRLEGYTYSVSSGASVNALTLTYSEEGKDFLYGTKVSDVRGEIDVGDYLVDSFSFTSAAGNTNYEYTDTDRYGGTLSQDAVTGMDVYTVETTKALALLATNVVPTKGNFELDPINMEGSYSLGGTPQSRNLGPYSREAFSFSAPRDDSGEPIECSETVVLSTAGGASYTFRVEWVDEPITGIAIDTVGISITDGAWPSMRQGRRSSYFYLESVPAYGDSEFFIDIVSGSEDGLVLGQWESDNRYGYPGFSYYIEAVTAGTYSFRIGIVGHEDEEALYTPTYTLVVNEPLSNAELEALLLGKTFTNYSFSTPYTLEFVSSSAFALSDGTNTVTVPYLIGDGAVSVPGEYFIISNSSFYFDRVLGGEILFSDDYRSLSLSLHSRNDTGDYSVGSYASYGFGLPVESLSGVTASMSEWVSALASRVTADVSFDETTGNIVLTRNASGAKLADISFSYSYDADTLELSVSNIVSSDPTYTLSDAWHMSGSSYRFSFSLSGERVYMDCYL